MDELHHQESKVGNPQMVALQLCAFMDTFGSFPFGVFRGFNRIRFYILFWPIHYWVTQRMQNKSNFEKIGLLR